MEKNTVENLKGKIIVSSQAMPNEPLYEENCMIAMMKSVVKGGASALRLAGARDVKNAKKLFDIPVIGLTKPDKIPANWKEIVYITPNVKDCKELIEAGADIIAFDGTSRQRPEGENLAQIIDCVKSQNKIPMADISTLEEAVNARMLGADIISTTLSGYTQNSPSKDNSPDFELVKKATEILDCPVFLEGRVWSVEDVEKAFEAGAYSVVIGSAITRPTLITKRFVERKK